MLDKKIDAITSPEQISQLINAVVKDGKEQADFDRVGELFCKLILKKKVVLLPLSSVEMAQKITRICHINEKLSESAAGADLTLHEIINEKLEELTRLVCAAQ